MILIFFLFILHHLLVLIYRLLKNVYFLFLFLFVFFIFMIYLILPMVYLLFSLFLLFTFYINLFLDIRCFLSNMYTVDLILSEIQKDFIILCMRFFPQRFSLILTHLLNYFHCQKNHFLYIFFSFFVYLTNSQCLLFHLLNYILESLTIILFLYFLISKINSVLFLFLLFIFPLDFSNYALHLI